MKACVNCKHGQWFNGAVRVCELDETAYKTDHTCNAWDPEDIHQRTLEEIDREEHHDF